MALELLSLSTSNFYAPRFVVEINDQKLAANISMLIMDISINEKMDEGASFNLTMHDEFDMARQQFKWLDDTRFFDVGKKISIKMGYGSNLYSMIVGKITSIEPSFFASETTTLTIGGQDLSYDYIKRTSAEKTFIDKSYSDIARDVAKDAGLLAVADDTGAPSEFVRKDNSESYYTFLERLATEVGYEFKVEGQTMYFVSPGDEKKEILTLELGKDIISFQPAMRTSGLYTEVEVRGHNPRDPNTPIIGSASAGSERSQEQGRQTASELLNEKIGSVRKVISNEIVNSVEQANALAKSILNKASDSLVEGNCESVGLPQIRAGVNIKLEKMGKRFSGKYYVKETTHTINESGYKTRFSVKRNAI